MTASRSPVGYSGTPLLKKLGYRDGDRALLIAMPDDLVELASFDGFARREHRASLTAKPPSGPFDLIHLFVTERRELELALPRLRAVLAPTGSLWVSWPKKSSKVPTTITEDVIREVCLPELVDVKVAAVSEIWSGLKLMIPLARRA
jgi:hypothetical protein